LGGASEAGGVKPRQLQYLHLNPVKIATIDDFGRERVMNFSCYNAGAVPEAAKKPRP
jgi:hypothetical protein